MPLLIRPWGPVERSELSNWSRPNEVENHISGAR